jgi:hypothetical protein
MTQIGKNGHVDHICIQEQSCANHRHGGRHLPTEILTVAQQFMAFSSTVAPQCQYVYPFAPTQMDGAQLHASDEKTPD